MGNNESHQSQQQQHQIRLIAMEKIVAESEKFAQKQSIVVENLRHRVRTLECRTEALEKMVHAAGLLIAVLLVALLVVLNCWSHHN